MPSFKASIVVLFAASHLAVASPVSSNSNQVNNAFSGPGGHASGGSVYSSESNNRSGLLAGITGKGGLRSLGVNLLSNNGGDGGHANSGPAAGSSGSGSVSFSGRPTNGSSNSNSVGNSYSGTGGDASGGSVYGSGGLINVLSNNAGDGGEANSGSAGHRNPPAGSRPRRLSSRIMRPRF